MKHQTMKHLYIVEDVPSDPNDFPSYRYVVKAESEEGAVKFIKERTCYDFDWKAELADNDEVWEQEG